MPQGLKDFIKKLIPKVLREKLLPIYHWFRAVFAATRYGFPTHGMIIVGITGTNGKTTTANMIGKILTDAGYKTGIFSSAVVQVDDDWQDSAMKLTTEDVFVLNRKFKEMQLAGVTHLVLETSSHAIMQHRIFGVHYSGAVFTNLSQDHLDYHHNMEAYARTKAKLFRKAKDFLVLNIDDEWFDYMLQKPATMITTYGKDADADLQITDVDVHHKGASANLVSEDGELKIHTKLSGDFNIYNAAAAVATCRKLGLEDKQITAGLDALQSVPGRMERIDEGQSFNVIVDHAHTPDSLDNLLKALKSVTKGKLMLLLGADGERDSGKRGPLGEVAAKYCDHVVVADQEPYGDPPAPIRKDIIDGLKKAEYNDFTEVADRKKAIDTLLKMAKKDDTVVLAGMGNQKYRGTAKGKEKWDEREVARKMLKKL